MKRKIFQQIASVALSATLVIAGIPAVFAEGVASNTVTASYDASADKLSLDVELATKGKKMVSVMVVPADIADMAPATLAAEPNVVIKAIQTAADGTAEFDMVMPSGFTGRYVVTVNVNDAYVSFAIFDIAASAADQMYADIANGNYTSVPSDLVNPNTDAQDVANIAKFMESNKATVIDSASAVNTYLAAEAIAYVMSEKMDIGEALYSYANYLGSSYVLDYLSETNDQEKAVMNDLFVKNGNAAPFADVYNDNKFIAQYQCAATSVNMGATLLAELEERGLTSYINLYNSIPNPANKEKVFDILFNSRANASSFSEIIEAFEAECYNQGADTNPNPNLGGGGGGGGGAAGGNAGNGVTTGTIGTIGVAPYPGVDYSNFNDVTGHWAKDSIDAMYTKGIINGFEDGSFRPELNVTRAEFAKMIVCLLGLDSNGSADFADVADNSWYNGYVAAAAKAGIVKGAEDGKFNPNAFITRQDAAVMLARVLEYKGIAMDAGAIEFNDSSDIAKYAVNSVNGMANLGIISGYNGGFAPLDNTTRAQAAALLQRVADHIG